MAVVTCFVPLLLISPSLAYHSSEAVVEFDQTFYTVVEGQSLSVMVSVRSGVTLERDVDVTLITVDGSAIGNV